MARAQALNGKVGMLISISQAQSPHRLLEISLKHFPIVTPLVPYAIWLLLTKLMHNSLVQTIYSQPSGCSINC